MAESASLKSIYDELKFIRQNMVSREDFNGILETFEVLHNSETLKQIKSSEEDVKVGRTKRVKSVKDIID